MSVQDAKVTSKFLSPTLNFQLHWRPAGRIFGALKNMGGLCLQILGSLGVFGGLRGLWGS